MKRTSPKVSVIIPFFSRRDWLVEAVESALSQSYKNFEIIVVNDGSKEDVTEFCRTYQGKIKYFCTENRGPGAARNLGIEKATGEYIAFLDSDDLWCEGKLEKQVDLMKTTNAIWSHTSYSFFQDQEPQKVRKRIDVSDYQGMVFPKCLLSVPIATPCVMIQAAYLRENTRIRFSEKMRYGQDSYLWMNLAVNQRLLAVPEVLTNIRIRGSNASQRVRAQLYAKGHLWTHIRQDWVRYSEKMDFVIKIAYGMCFQANKMLEFLEKTRIFNDGILEYISKMSYAFPYVTLKSYFHLIKGKK
jgi:glycosyltransferase involved in cell wall biosynthesis